MRRNATQANCFDVARASVAAMLELERARRVMAMIVGLRAARKQPIDLASYDYRCSRPFCDENIVGFMVSTKD